MKNWTIIFIVVCLTLIACESTPPVVVGMWTIENMQVGSNNLTAEDLYNPVYNFYKDGNYDIIMDDYVEKGTWTLDKQHFTLTKKDGTIIKLTLTDSTDEHLQYETGEGDSKTVVNLKKN